MSRKPTAEEIDRKKLLDEIRCEEYYLNGVIDRYIEARAKRTGTVRKQDGKVILEFKLAPYLGWITKMYEEKWERMIAAHKQKHGI